MNMQFATARARTILLGAALALAALIAGGCGPYDTYTGAPKAFSTHGFRITYPAGFTANELPQTSPDVLCLVVLAENKPVTPNAPDAPAMISVRCYRVKPDETPQTFMERYYDNLAPRFLDIRMRKIRSGRDAEEWSVTVDKAYLAAGVIVLPREKLAYDVTVVCKASDLPRFKPAFARTLDSFRVEGVK
jgi:hypothetical protein